VPVTFETIVVALIVVCHARWWHCGTVLQKSCLAASCTPLQLTSGVLVASLLKWLLTVFSRIHYSVTFQLLIGRNQTVCDFRFLHRILWTVWI